MAMENDPNKTAQASPAPADDKNVFTELFGADKVQKSANLMGNVTKQQDKTKNSFFKKKPKLKVAKKPALKTVSGGKVGKAVLNASIVLFLLLSGIFYTQNAEGFTWFGVNNAQRVVLVETQRDHVQAEIYVQRHLSAVLLLEQFSKVSDEYFYNLGQSKSPSNSKNKQADYTSTAEEKRAEALSIHAEINEQLADEIDRDELILAKMVFDELIASLQSGSGGVDEQRLLQNIQDIESAKTLMQSKEYKDSIKSVNSEEASDEELESIMLGYNKINESVISQIKNIQSERIDWSLYIQEIESLTKAVDPLFNTKFKSQLDISSLRFDSNGTVNIGGSTNTDDSKIFTLISNLLDSYEESPLFENVDERSFTKSGSLDESYSSSFAISLDITNE